MLALICATRSSTPTVLSFASLYPMHRHGKEGVGRRKNSSDPFDVKKIKKIKKKMNDKQYYPKKMWLLNKVKHFHSSTMVITEECFFLKRKTAL